MANSYTKILLHTTFHVKSGNRLYSEDLPGLYAYMRGVAEAEKCGVVAIGGTTDHVHILFALHPTMAPSAMMMKLKANSSRWLKERGTQYRAFAWQDGYGGFSVSPSNVARVVSYINNQEVHHRRMTFREEVEQLFKEAGIEYDERYI